MVDAHNALSAGSSATRLPEVDQGAEAPRFVEAGHLAAEAFRVLPLPILQMPVDDGRMTSFLARRLPMVVALGQNRGALELAGRRVRRSGDNNTVLASGSLSELQFPDEWFGGVLSVEYLGHVRQPVGVLREMLRVCAPGGCVIADFMAPQDSTRRLPGMRADVAGGYMDQDTGEFHRYMDRWRLEEILGEAGVREPMFEIVEKSWEGDPVPGGDDVLSRRHSLVAVIHKPS